MNIINTPGLRNSSGIDMDRKIVQMIRTTLLRLDALDYLMIVTKASENRLQPETTNALNTIHGFYDKKIAERVIAGITHADAATSGPDSLAIGALK